MTGLPAGFLSGASASGCAAFRHGRIYALDLFKWIASDGGEEELKNWDGINKEMEAKLKMIKVGVEQRDLIGKAEVAECLQTFSGIVFGAMKRMTLEFPRNLEMRPKNYIKQAMAGQYDEVLKRANGELEKLQQIEKKKQPNYE